MNKDESIGFRMVSIAAARVLYSFETDGCVYPGEIQHLRERLQAVNDYIPPGSIA